MTNSIVDVAQVALKGLTDRRTAITDNMSNINTPGYLAKTSDFETNLKRALGGDTSVNVLARRGISMTPTNMNGNNVDMDNETVSAIETQLRYSTMIEIVNSKFRGLRTAMGN